MICKLFNRETGTMEDKNIVEGITFGQFCEIESIQVDSSSSKILRKDGSVVDGTPSAILIDGDMISIMPAKIKGAVS